MILIDFIVNLSVFSLLVSTPLIIRSFINHKPLKQLRLWTALYAGVVSSVLIGLSYEEQGYSYDIRYAVLILVFAYLGPAAGLITGSFALLTRLMANENWLPAIAGWMLIMIIFTLLHFYYSDRKPGRRSFALLCAYIAIYIVLVPILFNVLRDEPLFHFQYILFVIFGVILGGILIESYENLYRIIAEKKRMDKTLEASEFKYRLIAENTSDLIMVMNKECIVSYSSPSHEVVLGHKASELESAGLSKMLHPDDEPLFLKAISKIKEKNEWLSIELRFMHKDGEWFEFESRCMPVIGENQRIEHIVMVSRDISERKKAEEMLLQSEKLSIVGELAAGVAHEIRNPLTTIKGFIQLYKKENNLIEFNDLILSELERIETITSEMLSLGKPQAIQLHQANLRNIIENTVELLSPQGHMNDIQFKLSTDDDDFSMMCEQNQLKQVFLNIFKNAMEAMPKGGEIHISLERGPQGICTISIQDQGCGIPDEILPRLGEPFYTLKEKGTGLGLMICHRIIKQHLGTISYQSKLNEGTLIEIRLPLDQHYA